jgi:hypothetical protein
VSHTKTLISGKAQNQLHPPHIGGGLGGGGCLFWFVFSEPEKMNEQKMYYYKKPLYETEMVNNQASVANHCNHHYNSSGNCSNPELHANPMV